MRIRTPDTNDGRREVRLISTGPTTTGPGKEAPPFCCITFVNNLAHRSPLVPVAVVY